MDLNDLDSDMQGNRSQVLVLGTVHLSGIEGGVPPGALNGLLDKLKAFSPDIVAIEAISGEQCDLAARHPEKYGSDYCPRTHPIGSEIDSAAALAELESFLIDWPAAPTPAQRRSLVSKFLAANDLASAYAQWLQLPTNERHADESLTESYALLLNETADRNNENYRIGARLAAELGLTRVHAINDHTGDRFRSVDEEELGLSIQEAWDSDRDELDDRLNVETQLANGSDLVPLYRYINHPDHLRILAENNVKTAMLSASPKRYPQVWVGGWEIRNLRMAANIRETFRERPGARVLVIVGVSHKPWLDAWLGQFQGVTTVDALKMLE